MKKTSLNIPYSSHKAASFTEGHIRNII